MYETRKAFDKEIYGERTIILCGIERGTCPYNNEGHLLECGDGAPKIMCRSVNAKVEKKRVN